MCEELSKKAADLAYENENLRRVCKTTLFTHLYTVVIIANDDISAGRKKIGP